MKISVNVAGIDAVRANFARLNDALQNKALANTAVEIEQYITQQADTHSKTGQLVRSIDSRKVPVGYEIFHDLQHAPHAVFVHWGAKAHVIKPKDKKVLRWVAGDQFAFAKEVHHPGYKGDPWMKRAADLAPRIFAKHVETLLRSA